MLVLFGSSSPSLARMAAVLMLSATAMMTDAAYSDLQWRTTMSAEEVSAFESVARSCARDVELLCPSLVDDVEGNERDEAPPPAAQTASAASASRSAVETSALRDLIPSDDTTVETSSDENEDCDKMTATSMTEPFIIVRSYRSGPFLRGGEGGMDTADSVMPPHMEDLGPLIDSMMSMVMSDFDEFFAGGSGGFFGPPPPPAMRPDAEDDAVDRLFSGLAMHTPPHHMELLADNVALHGQNLLERPFALDGDSDDAAATMRSRRMARRLTEVSAEELMDHRYAVLLPFGTSDRNKCLLSEFESGSVSRTCSDDMLRLRAVRSAHQVNLFQQRVREQQEEYAAAQLLVLYGLLFVALAVVVMRRRGEIIRHGRMRLRILQAVYSRPAIKSSVEKELGGSLGHVPPLSFRQLRMSFGAGSAALRRKMRNCMRMRVLLAVALCLFVSFTTMDNLCNYVLPVCSIAVVLLLLRALFGPKREAVCTCCCCDLSTEDVKNGATLTELQACCSCCQGTGVCSVQCASCCCCGPDSPGSKKKRSPSSSSKGCCGCCGCCSSSGGCCCSKGKEGEVGSCCGGCCCSSSPSGKEKSSSSSKKDGRGQKHRVLAGSPVVYEGVSVQVV